MSGTGFAKRITLDNLDAFAPLLRQRSQSGGHASDRGAEDEQRSGERDPAIAAAESLFGGVHVAITLPFHRRKRAATAQQQHGESQSYAPPTYVHGPLLWRKVLAASDVGQQSGNPTGGVRLTQAKFKVNGMTIDQTTYFRNLFASFQWTHGTGRTQRIDAIVPFCVSAPALNADFGLVELTVSHKPAGEAGQGNYTTILQWKDLSWWVRKTNLTGRTFSLYGPAPGESEPFFIEIT